MKEKKQMKHFITSFGAVSMAAALGMGPGACVFAASPDSIVSSQTGSINIHKYDITAAESKGVYKQGTYAATGEVDSRVENALKGYEIEGVGFSYLKISDAELYESSGTAGTDVMVVYEIPEQLAQILGLSPVDAINLSGTDVVNPCGNTGVYHYTSTQISAAMAQILKNDNIMAKNQLEEYLKASGSSVSMPETDAAGFTSASGLSLGLYLLVETSVPEDVVSTVDPWLIQLPFTDSDGDEWLYDITCYPKDQTGNPTIDKSVRSADDTEEGEYRNTATASEGDILDYILVSKMPHITSEATYLTEYTFADTLSRGLTYNQDLTIYFYHTQEDAGTNNTAAADEVWKQEDGLFKGTYAATADGGSTLTVEMTEMGLEKLNQKSDAYIVVSYTVQLNSDSEVVLGDEGNPNDVQLTWRRTSDSYYNTLEDRNYVYSYGLDLTKSFSDEQGSFSNVKFSMFNESDQYYVVARKVSDGLYQVTGKAEKEADATIFVPHSSKGTLVINGLEADSYQVKENATDSGYSLLQSPVSVVISSTDRTITQASVTLDGKNEMFVGDILPASAEIDGKASDMNELHAYAVLKVINNKNVVLPQTGGNGVYLVTILGVLAVAGGCFIVLGKKKA